MEKKLEKILVRYYSNLLEKVVVETLWAEAVNEQESWYKIDNIPFYGADFSLGDIVLAEYDENEEFTTYRKVINRSGNSTIQVVLIDEKANKETIRTEFSKLGAESEGVNQIYFVMNIPSEVSYQPILKKLNQLEKEGIIEFAEAYLSDKHIDNIKD
ncbi:MAG: DUF4265 domain-containing protein [Capnocytophaga felis]|nr:DUF4265 domain-containing protein [Capnocytophaga felis]